MKKLIIPVLLILAMSLMLTACSSPEKTDAVIRWDDNETFVFNISKVNWNYPNKKETINDAEKEFVKYPHPGNEIVVQAKDEIAPENLEGTYTMEISRTNETDRPFELTTEQVLYMQYSNDVFMDGILEKLKDFVVADDDADCPLERKSGYTILRSKTLTSVKFRNESSQKPISSTNKCDGFYIGKTEQNIGSYDYSTTYDWDKNQVIVTDNTIKENNTKTYSIKKNVTLIDANQILLYARSLEKTATKFQDNPSVRVFSAVAGETYAASFLFTYSCNTLVTKADGSDQCSVLNMLAISVNGSPLLTQLNLPETVNTDDKILDGIKNEGGKLGYNKYTTVRFRSGILEYEIQNYSEDILNAIKAK